MLLLVQLALNHHLSRDSGVIHSDDPERVLALQSFVADDDVLQRVIERMTDMQAAGNIGWRIDDGEWFAIIAFRTEKAFAFPVLIPARFNGGGIEIFI